ncbi:MAG TPA: flagellar protein FlaG [Terriglobales bacterium]|nr:flagellar protein FlaG [Terriglobales bacterium]
MAIDSVNGTVPVQAEQWGSGSTRTTSKPTPSADPHPLPASAVLPDRKVSVALEDNQVVYRFIDQRSGELLQQVPPEEVLRVMRNIAELQKEIAQRVNHKA